MTTIGSWQFSTTHNSACKIIEEQEADWCNELETAKQIVPEIRSLLLMHICHSEMEGAE